MSSRLGDMRIVAVRGKARAPAHRRQEPEVSTTKEQDQGSRLRRDERSGVYYVEHDEALHCLGMCQNPDSPGHLPSPVCQCMKDPLSKGPK